MHVQQSRECDEVIDIERGPPVINASLIIRACRIIARDHSHRLSDHDVPTD